MLTISRLAAYAGVTVRAVRHYHQIGLLPEPERTYSGYRVYDAAAVVRLIKIRTLTDAGVPLAGVRELLDAEPEAFARALEQVDADLRTEIRRLQANRRAVAKLAAGEHLALPRSVVDYHARLHALGIDERYTELERDSWIIIAAQAPDEIDAYVESKHAELEDPEMVALYRLLSEAMDWTVDEPRIVEVADILERLMLRAIEKGDQSTESFDDTSVELLDAMAADASPLAERLLEILEERGWKGWTRIERVPHHP